ncbi:uncharacterized protein P884DRAFT_262415 [Thermothelomyces heterothallicus CBS 202.75]|uniref:uncharacterized protein n=1 Tax=Thermothelomyces heterothallicus CBS 202.75 TaxID=1149848 RepID=UPI003742D54E
MLSFGSGLARALLYFPGPCSLLERRFRACWWWSWIGLGIGCEEFGALGKVAMFSRYPSGFGY